MEEPDLDKGGSPLMHAANCGHAAAVTALIEVRAARIVGILREVMQGFLKVNGEYLMATG